MPNILKVSVIIPFYNEEAFLERAIASALHHPEVAECILIDDGSSDQSLVIAQRFAEKDERVLVLTHADGKNHGAGSARNVGFRRAREEYIAFLDADDYWMENRFAHTEAIFSNHPGTVGVYEAIATENWDGNVDDPKLTMLRSSPEDGQVFFEMTPFGKNGHFSLIGLTVRREVLEKTGLFSTNFALTQDTEWIAKLALTGKLAGGKIHEIVAIRNVHAFNSTNDIPKLMESRVAMCFSLLKWTNANCDFAVSAAVVNTLLKYHYENNCLNTGSWFKRKRADILFIRKLRGIDPELLRIPKVRYFIRLVLHLKRGEEFDFYG